VARLILHRLAATIPVLLLVTAGVFTLIHLTPGDPIDAMMAESVDDSVKQRLRQDLGLDRPLYLQYASWMGRLSAVDRALGIRLRGTVMSNICEDRSSAVAPTVSSTTMTNGRAESVSAARGRIHGGRWGT